MTLDTATMIWSMLAATGLGTAFMHVERLMYYFTHREAEYLAFDGWLRAPRPWLLVCEPAALRRLGWLGRVLDRAAGEVPTLRQLCFAARRDAERFLRYLETAVSVAQFLGLLGSVAGLAQAAVGAADPLKVIGLAMGTTIAGLGVAIPTAMLLAWFSGRSERIVEQIDLVLERLEQAPSEPAAGPAASRPPLRLPPARHAPAATICGGHPAPRDAATDNKGTLPCVRDR